MKFEELRYYSASSQFKLLQLKVNDFTSKVANFLTSWLLLMRLPGTFTFRRKQRVYPLR